MNPPATPTTPLTQSVAGTFMERLRRRWYEGRTLLCIGLDPDVSRLPDAVRLAAPQPLPPGVPPQPGAPAAVPALKLPVEQAIFAFNQAIISATAEYACAYKPNAAFYEQYGLPGWRALAQTIRYIQATYPDIPVLLDAKRGDIGSTSEAYAKAAFDELRADGVTLQPYLGAEALKPFLDRAERGCFILCRTSNAGAGEFQDLTVTGPSGAPEPLYMAVARQVAGSWNANRNCGIVVGATYPDELKRIREVVGDLPILVPGIGTQGGDLRRVLEVGLDSQGAGLLISVSRQILYASNGADFAKAAQREAEHIHRVIQRMR